MRFATSLTLLTFLGAASTAWGQALDDDGKPVPTTDPAAAPTPVAPTAEKLEYGVGLRLRRVFVPNGLLELFIERAGDGASNTGIGVDLVRRRGDLELQLGFEFEHIQPGEGVWINKNEPVEQNFEADYLISSDRAGKSLGWFSVEFTFLKHTPLAKNVALRYGGGAGLGFLTGGLQKYDVPCTPGSTNENPEPGCVPLGLTSPSGQMGTAVGARGPTDYDLPPVFPVINAIIGVQVRPMPKMTVNIETGIRTIPFVGMSVGYFF